MSAPWAHEPRGARYQPAAGRALLAPVALAHGVRVSVIEPAAVASDFVGNVEQAGGDESHYAAQLAAYRARTEQAFAQAQSARSAGEAIADAAPDHAPDVRHHLSEAQWHLLRAETSCNLYWGEAWLHKVHHDLNGCHENLEQVKRLLGDLATVPGEPSSESAPVAS